MSLRELKKQHGEYVQVADAEYIFEDGTQVTGDHFLVVHEPPDATRGRRNFTAAKLQQEIAAFTSFKDKCEQQANFASRFDTCSPPSERAIGDLKRGKARIAELRAELATLDAVLGESPQQAIRRQRQEQAADQHQRIGRVQQQIAAITLD